MIKHLGTVSVLTPLLGAGPTNSDTEVAVTTSCGLISLDPKGHLNYAPQKKRLLITSPTRNMLGGFNRNRNNERRT
jgi:hypothetical protein